MNHSFVSQYVDENGKIYCRIVHGVLDVQKDQTVCGLGCPYFQKDGGCGFYESLKESEPKLEAASIKKAKKSAQSLKDDIEHQIKCGAQQLFPVFKALQPLINRAYQYAAEAHIRQMRKGTDIPYFTHIITAMNYALELTDNQEILAAVVLHDTVEDTWVTIEDIREKFGNKVADFVAAETENKREHIPAKDTWELRKQETIQHLQNASHDVKIIVLADKAANAESMSREWRLVGDSIWEKFNQKDKSKQAWYYYACANALQEFADTKVMKQYLSYMQEIFDGSVKKP